MAGSKSLTFVQMNDTHAYFEQHPELFWAGDHAEYRLCGGYARIATLLQEIRAERPGEVVAVDCGDTIHGTYAAVKTEGEALLPILRLLDFTAWTGHWEFAYGPERLKEVVGKLPYPFLASNCFDKETGELVFTPYIVREVNGMRVGLIGLAAYIVDKMMPASFSRGIRMTLARDQLPDHIRHLHQEEKVDLVAVISHFGFPQECKLAQEVDGIDVLFSAHTHNRTWAPAVVNDTIIMQSGSQGSFLGRLSLEIEGKRVRDFSHRLLVVDDAIRPDPAVDALVQEALAPYRDYLAEVVGETRTALNRDRVLESTMDNFLLQALLHAHDAELAFSHGWRYGAPIPAGPLTVNDLHNIIPVNPYLFAGEIGGDELWEMLEQNLEHVFSRDPYQQMGGYIKRCLGLTCYFKVENPPGRRIQELFVRGEKVRPDRLYSTVFVTTQGVPEKYGQNRQNLKVKAVEALRHYLRKESPVTAPLRGTFTPV